MLESPLPSSQEDPFSQFRSNILPKLSDVLFTQTSCDLSHLTFIEACTLEKAPMSQIKAAIGHLLATAQLRSSCCTAVLREIENIDEQQIDPSHGFSQDLQMSDPSTNEHCYQAVSQSFRQKNEELYLKYRDPQEK